MYFAVFALDKSGTADLRNTHFDAFREYLHDHPDHPDVVVHHGGPILSDDGNTMVGTQLVLETSSLEAARAFVSDSPFGRVDLYAELQVHPWNWMTGSPG